MSAKRRAKPLNRREEQTWRSLIRLMIELPRAIDDDLLRRTGLSLTRYVVLMRLSESPDRALRMSDLAEAASISPSRLTRVVHAMVDEGLLLRAEVPGDRRASRATLTDEGLAKLQEAWPEHLASVRQLVIDNVKPDDLAELHRMTERIRRGLSAGEAAL